jgi:hypothetical protein
MSLVIAVLLFLLKATRQTCESNPETRHNTTKKPFLPEPEMNYFTIFKSINQQINKSTNISSGPESIFFVELHTNHLIPAPDN